jgi:iron complex transport system substrate-binding protein
MLLKCLAFAAVLFSSLATAAPAEPLVIKHASGETTLAATPKTVVVYDFGALENLDLLGIEVQGVPGSTVPSSLDRYKGDTYAKIGSLFEPDFEAVAALQPDLVIVAQRSGPHYKALSAIAPTIDLTIAEDEKLIDGVRRNATTLARIFGKQDEMATRLAALDTSIATLQALAGDRGRGLILMTSAGKVSAYGPGSRFGILHDTFGIKPTDASLQQAIHGQVISQEYILQQNPDWLFVIDRDSAIGQEGQAAAAVLDNEIVRRTVAWQKGQVLYLEPSMLYLTNAGVRSQQTIVDTLTQAFQKAK